MDTIYITGHRNPDTDSIVSAMAYAALKNALGQRQYEAARLGQISDEMCIRDSVSGRRARASQVAARRMVIPAASRRMVSFQFPLPGMVSTALTSFSPDKPSVSALVVYHIFCWEPSPKDHKNFCGIQHFPLDNPCILYIL